jgi:hypothetical protein
VYQGGGEFLRDPPCLPEREDEGIPARPRCGEILTNEKKRRNVGMKLLVRMSVGGLKRRRVMLDTCAEANVITHNMVKKLGLKLKENHTTNVLGSIDNNKTKVIGQVEANLDSYNYVLNVINGELSRDAGILLGWPSLSKKGIKLVSMNNKVDVEVGGKPLRVEKITSMKERDVKKKDVVDERVVELRAASGVSIGPREQLVVEMIYDTSMLREGESMIINPSRVIRATPLKVASGKIEVGD